MSDGLNVIIIDDEPTVCEIIFKIIKGFYTWGEVLAFTDIEEARSYCNSQEIGVAIFILDVFLGDGTGFMFLDSVSDKFPMANEDTIIITGNASEDVVNMCVASEITHLLEKPIRPYALQLSIMSIVTKYIKFAKRILNDPVLAENVANL
jgi:response regulator of citrate/malate metabolism